MWRCLTVISSLRNVETGTKKSLCIFPITCDNQSIPAQLNNKTPWSLEIYGSVIETPRSVSDHVKELSNGSWYDEAITFRVYIL